MTHVIFEKKNECTNVLKGRLPDRKSQSVFGRCFVNSAIGDTQINSSRSTSPIFENMIELWSVSCSNEFGDIGIGSSCQTSSWFEYANKFVVSIVSTTVVATLSQLSIIECNFLNSYHWINTDHSAKMVLPYARRSLALKQLSSFSLNKIEIGREKSGVFSKFLDQKIK